MMMHPILALPFKRVLRAFGALGLPREEQHHHIQCSVSSSFNVFWCNTMMMHPSLAQAWRFRLYVFKGRFGAAGDAKKSSSYKHMKKRSFDENGRQFWKGRRLSVSMSVSSPAAPKRP